MSFELHIVCATGLGDPNFVETGVETIAKIIRERSGPEVFVGLYKWFDLDGILDDIRRNRPQVVVGIGHSYGFSSIAWACRILKTERPRLLIRDVLAIDPIWRKHKKFPSFGSLFDGHMIELTNNVRNAYCIRQNDRGNLLRGHQLKVSPPTLLVEDMVLEDVSHPATPDHPHVRKVALRIAGVSDA